MKVFKKRVIALLIDSLLFGIFYELCRGILSDWFMNIGTIGNICLFAPLFFKDLAFKNASIGKKIMGIAIYDNSWKIPKAALLIKRTILMCTVGYIIFVRAKLVDGELISLIDWERERLGTRVVDKRILKKLQEESCNSPNREKEMTRLYDEYLREIYVK